MKRLLITVFCMLFATSTLANHEVSVEGLTEVQKAEIATAVAKAKLDKEREKVASGTAPVERVGQWAELGANLGKALAGTARELGVVANEFVKSPVGQITAAIIIYKFIGKDILHIGIGGIFLIVAGSFWIYTFRRVCLIDRVVVDEITEEKKKTKRTQVIYGDKWANTRSDTVGFFFMTGLIIVAISLGIMFMY